MKIDKDKVVVHMVWGCALVFMGLSLLFQIPQGMHRVQEIQLFSSTLPFIRFCFYVIAVLLIAGGSQKLYLCFKILKENKKPE